MTVREALTACDNLEPNAFDDETKIRWLAYIDGDIRLETIESHEHEGDLPDTHYDSTNVDAELLAPYPHDELYVYYLRMRINEANDEMSRYSNLAAMFNQIYNDYLKKYNREHKPLGSSGLKFR